MSLAQIVVMFKGGNTQTIHVKDAPLAADMLAEHVSQYGFSGWRNVCGYLVNMSEVQSIGCFEVQNVPETNRESVESSVDEALAVGREHG